MAVAPPRHWEDLEDFAARFPNLDLQPDRWVVDEPVFYHRQRVPVLGFMLALIQSALSFYPAALDSSPASPIP